MARLPQPGGDEGQWGQILNDFLSQAHNADGSLKQLSQSQIQNLVSDLAGKVNTTDLKPVATSGSYADLTNKPSIPATAADVGAVSTTGLDAATAALVDNSSSSTTTALKTALTPFGTPGERTLSAVDVSTQPSPATFSLKRRRARRELYTLKLPMGMLDLSQSPLLANGSIWNHIPYTNGGLTLGYSAAGALTLSHTSDATVTDSALHLWQARPFATVDLTVSALTASVYGYTYIEWRNADGSKRLLFSYQKTNNLLLCQYLVNNVASGSQLSTSVTLTAPYTLRVQMQGRNAIVWAVSGTVSTYLGLFDFSANVDLRDPAQIAGWTVGIGGRGGTDFTMSVSAASMYLAGNGHADPRIVSYEDGTPIQSGETVWVCMTTRGSTIPDAYEGVYALNTTTGELTAAGAIFCDRGDGIWRNETAGHLMFDRVAQQWRYFAIGHSDSPGPRYVYLASTSADLRFGMNLVPVSQVNITGDDGLTTFYEDFYPIWDSAASKWVASASKNANTTARLEATVPAGPWTETLNTGNVNETGNLIVKSGANRYVLAGTGNSGASNSYIVRDYNTLASLGNVAVDFSTGGARVWPCLFPVKTASGIRWHMLSFDRTIPAGTYSYGRLHLYGS